MKNNTDKENTGENNTGNRNSGDWNSGNLNSGNLNSGNWNSGNLNSGYLNSGDWNSGNWNSGYFNVDKPKVRIFGKETDVKREDINFPSWLYFDLTKWVSYDDMTDKEKEDNSFAKVTEGYLKTYEYKEAFKMGFDKTDKEGIKLLLELPNFNHEMFERISGISKEMIDVKVH